MKTLYFASDMQEHCNQIYLKSQSTKMAPMVKPTNLGPKINTEGRDISFLNDEQELYFASDGHPD
jgi:hypothetical protein